MFPLTNNRFQLARLGGETMVLNRRILRDLKHNFIRYSLVFLVIVISMYVVVGMAGSAQTVISGVEEHAIINGVEDGHFSLFVNLTPVEVTNIENYGAIVEKQSYLDFRVDDSTLRIFANRKRVNKLEIDQGRVASVPGEIVLEKNYSKANGILIGDSIRIDDTTFIVVGIGSTPDYDDVLRNQTDASSNPLIFGTSFVTNADYVMMTSSKGLEASELIQYSYMLNEVTQDDITKELNKLQFSLDNVSDPIAFSYFSENEQTKNEVAKNLKELVQSSSNKRINASADDIQVNKTGALIIGVIILMLLAYILSIFATNTIEKESKVIGTLYAMGIVKNELLFHYILLPTFICLLGGLLGTTLGFVGMDIQIAENSNYYSYPILNHSYPLYLIIYGVFTPFIMSIIINVVLINRKLSNEPLALLNKKQSEYSNKRLNLGNMKFMNRFRVKLFLKEIKSNLTISIGMFTSLLLIMLALCIFSALTNIVTETDNDVKFEYMYHVAYPEDIKPKGAEAAYMSQFKKEALGYDFDISLLGIETNSVIFPYDIATDKNEIYVSTSVANKFNVSVGDDFILEDNINNITYNFIVKEVVNYAPGLFVFTEISTMRNLLHKHDEYYNTLFSMKPLTIETGRLYSTTTGKEIREASKIFMKLMKSLIYVLIISSTILFVLVMYLMVKMIIERQTSNISMFKIFGYNEAEISRLYLRNNLYTVIVSAVIFIPISRWITVKIYPYLVANKNVGFNLSFSKEIYVFIFALILMSYLFALYFAKIKLNKISMQDVLKERE